MKVTFRYMCDEICRFRGIMESSEKDIWQKDHAFRTLMWTWVNSDHRMTTEEEESLVTLIQAHGYEWTRRRYLEMMQSGCSVNG